MINIDRFKNIDSENLAFFFFSASVICTVLGPAVHYSMWILTLLTLVYSKVKNGNNFFPSVHCHSKKAFVLLMLFAFWASVPNFLTAESTYIWAHGLSCYAEFLLGIIFTMRVLNTEERLDSFIKWFVVINSVFAVLYTLHISSYFFGIPKSFNMPNGTMINNNTSGTYAFMIMPFIVYYAFSKVKNHGIRLLMCAASLSVILISTSSGTWLTSAIEALIILFFILKNKKADIKTILVYVLIVISVLTLCDFATGKKASKMIVNELKNSKSLVVGTTNLNDVTNERYDIWRATIYMSKKHPIVGYGKKSYFDEFGKNMETFKEMFPEFRRRSITSHSHSMYLEILFAGGYPALFFYCSGYLLLLAIALKSTKNKNKTAAFLSVVTVTILAGNMIYGTNGDIYEGRRDIAVIFYTIMGIVMILPTLHKRNGD